MQFQDLFWMAKHILGTFLSGFASNAFLFLQSVGKMRVKQLMEVKKSIERVKKICLVEFKLLIKKVSKELFLRTSDFICKKPQKSIKMRIQSKTTD